MEYLFITSRNTQIKTIPTYENHPLLGCERTAGKPEKYFRLLKRSFYTIYNLPKEELDRPLLLYGDVKLKYDKKDHKLIIFDQYTGRRIRYFWFYGNLDVDESALYRVALLAVFPRDEKLSGVKCRLYNNNSVKIRKIQ